MNLNKHRHNLLWCWNELVLFNFLY